MILYDTNTVPIFPDQHHRFGHLISVEFSGKLYMQVMQTSTKNEFQELQIKNITGVITYYFSYPGSKEVWNNVKHTFEPVQDIVGAEIT